MMWDKWRAYILVKALSDIRRNSGLDTVKAMYLFMSDWLQY